MSRLHRGFSSTAVLAGLVGVAFADPRAWDHRLSQAARRQSLTVEPTDDLAKYRDIVARIDRDMLPSLEAYEQGRERGPTPRIRMMATYGAGMAHLTTIVRARNAARAPELAYGDRLVSIETLLVDHRAAALAAFRDVLELDAPVDRVTSFIVADARRQVEALQPSGEALPSVSIR